MPNPRPMPGIVFDAESAPPLAALPRMDVAGFVGFAASGPLDTPVLVEEIGRFHEIFGEDLMLAWDATRADMAAGYLAPSVRTFFRNGGKRCWVVRVAGVAKTNCFAVPGVLRASSDGLHRAATVQARSPGSWSDDVSVNAFALATPVVVGETGAIDSSRYFVRLSQGSLAAGDLIRIDYPTSGCVQLLPVTAVGGGTGTFPQPYWFRTVGGPESAGATLAEAVHLRPDADTVLAGAVWAGGGDLAFTARRRDVTALQEGSLLRLRFTSGAIVFLEATEIRSLPSSGGEEVVRIAGARAWQTLTDAAGKAATAGTESFAARVEVSLWARLADGRVLPLDGVGMVPIHPRYFGALPTDEVLFTPPDRPRINPNERLWREASQPRYPLAGSETGDCLPLAVLAAPREEFYRPSDPPGPSAWFPGQPATRLERDGLADFNASLFLDPNLAGKSSNELETAAYAKLYGLRTGRGTEKRLEKLHALLPVEAVSMVAIPDCVHAGWEPDEGEVEHWPAPSLSGGVQPDGTYRLSWSEVAGAVQYQIEESHDPRFSLSRRTDAGVSRERLLEGAAGCPRWLYYRVRARRGNRWSPWSQTVARRSPPETFLDPQNLPLPAPVLSVNPAGGNRIQLNWTGGLGSIFTLESSTEPEFIGARTLYDGEALGFGLIAHSGVSYFRVGARRDDHTSAWSNTIAYGSATTGQWKVKARPQPDQEPVLGTVHSALLRFCAARGDLVTLLSLPAEFREKDTVLYEARLLSSIESDEGRTLSFGAIFHPWPVVRDFVTDRLPRLRALPPDGVIAGSLAARTLRGGAWEAAANQPLRDAVALDPALGADAAILLRERQVNRIEQNVRGFLTLGEDTLSDDPSLRPLHVRRLLILLRRLALREGTLFVFQPNDESFRRLVRRHFQDALSGLFQRGAFAGLTPGDAFRVVTDASVNRPESVDAGRFIVELKVAPSQPLAFLTVRLLETGGGVLTTEEV